MEVKLGVRHSRVDVGAVGGFASKLTAPLARAPPHPSGVEVLVPGPAGVPVAPKANLEIVDLEL